MLALLKFLLLAAPLASRATPTSRAPHAAAGPEIVIGNEVLVEGGTHVEENLNAFLRRLEEVGGWPAGSLHGKAFTQPREALDYIRANKVPFAILPPHQFVEARKELKAEVLGRAVGVDGAGKDGYWGVAKSGDRAWGHPEEVSGLRLAATETHDEQWLRVLMEGNVSEPFKHFKLMNVPTAADGVAAVTAGKADLALVDEHQFAALKTRLLPGGDLTWVYATGHLPPPAVVSLGKWSTVADRKKMTTALATLCKGEGGDACARMGILYVEVGRAKSYEAVIEKYANYR
jgi:ABC-type phosphate/phosphonate transport system substrate-binding protein